ncbi:hypothetical protein OF83DRAFT_1057720, partial [Amylostereum chailletii]
ARTPFHSYLVHLADTTSYILKLSPPSPPASSYAPNTIVVQHKLLSHLHSQPQATSLPLASPVAFDTSFSIIPYQYLLLALPRDVQSMVSLADARPSMSVRQNALIDLKVGAFLKTLHDVQNDWFGTPTMEGDGLYNWQEAFTLMLEEVLHATEGLDLGGGLDLDFREVRRLLSRAIGFFLFDDAEVPSFVWFTGGEEHMYVTMDGAEDPELVLALVDLSRAVWGDPLLERLFVDPKPSQALLEGYEKPLVVFARQRTKRVWYTLYMVLLVLLERSDDDRATRAKEMARECVETLKDAPCY